MATYTSVTNGIEGTWPSVQYTVEGGGCSAGTLTSPAGSAGPFPTPTAREYTPYSHSESRYDPTKDDRRNFEAIKRSGSVSMTPYGARRETVENFVVSRHYEIAAWRRKTGACRINTPYSCLYDGGPEKYVTSWTQNDHIGSLSPNIPYAHASSEMSEYEGEISDAISSTQQEAFADAMSTYDLLSELAEAKETLSFLSTKFKGAADALREFAYTDEPTHRRARSVNAKTLIKASDKALRKYGSRWMEYRYAIMPIVYSIQDINKLLGERDHIYKTARKRQTVTLDHRGESSSNIYLFENVNFKTEVRSTVKLGYDNGALQRLFSQVTFNPMKTAWELIPYSFVVDWFFNVGTVIEAASALDFSSTKAGCTSVKRVEKSEIWLHDHSSDVYERTLVHDACGNIDVQHRYNRSVEGLLQRKTIESYDRFLFSRPEPKLLFDPFLNWKRFLDSIVLSHQPIKKLLRSL